MRNQYRRIESLYILWWIFLKNLNLKKKIVVFKVKMLIYKEIMYESKDPIDLCFSQKELDKLIDILLDMPVGMSEQADCKHLKTLSDLEKQEILYMLHEELKS